jgi:hypothetical protein
LSTVDLRIFNSDAGKLERPLGHVRDIDLVYTWVNSQDATLNAVRDHYASSEVVEDRNYRCGKARFSDHNELAYSLQSVSRYAPFIRKIYIVHAGTVPTWLRSLKWLDSGSEIVLIRQEELLPEGLAPTFQSDVIECYLYRIPGLSEHYLYSNDDFFFSRSHVPADFFTEDGRCLVGVCDRFAALGRVDGAYADSERNSVRALQRRLRLQSNVRVGTKWPNRALNHPGQRLRALARGIRLVNIATHVTQPFRRSHWEDFHRIFSEEVQALSARRFRSRHGFTTNMMYHQYLRSIDECTFYFEARHAFLDRRDSMEARERFFRTLVEQPSEISRFCLNDGASPDYDGWSFFISMLMNQLGYKSTDLLLLRT